MTPHTVAGCKTVGCRLAVHMPDCIGDCCMRGYRWSLKLRGMKNHRIVGRAAGRETVGRKWHRNVVDCTKAEHRTAEHTRVQCKPEEHTRSRKTAGHTMVERRPVERRTSHRPVRHSSVGRTTVPRKLVAHTTAQRKLEGHTMAKHKPVGHRTTRRTVDCRIVARTVVKRTMAERRRVRRTPVGRTIRRKMVVYGMGELPLKQSNLASHKMMVQRKQVEHMKQRKSVGYNLAVRMKAKRTVREKLRGTAVMRRML